MFLTLWSTVQNRTRVTALVKYRACFGRWHKIFTCPIGMAWRSNKMFMIRSGFVGSRIYMNPEMCRAVGGKEAWCSSSRGIHNSTVLEHTTCAYEEIIRDSVLLCISLVFRHCGIGLERTWIWTSVFVYVPRKIYFWYMQEFVHG